MEKPLSDSRSACPIACTLDIFGDRWTLLILRDLFLGPKKFSDFESAPERIPSNILASRLRRLLEQGFISRHAYQERPVRYEYRLTRKGNSTGPVLKAIVIWANSEIPGTIRPEIIYGKPQTDAGTDT